MLQANKLKNLNTFQYNSATLSYVKNEHTKRTKHQIIFTFKFQKGGGGYAETQVFRILSSPVNAVFSIPLVENLLVKLKFPSSRLSRLKIDFKKKYKSVR